MSSPLGFGESVFLHSVNQRGAGEPEKGRGTGLVPAKALQGHPSVAELNAVGVREERLMGWGDGKGKKELRFGTGDRQIKH